MYTVLVSTHGFKNELCFLCSVQGDLEGYFWAGRHVSVLDLLNVSVDNGKNPFGGKGGEKRAISGRGEDCVGTFDQLKGGWLHVFNKILHGSFTTNREMSITEQSTIKNDLARIKSLSAQERFT